LKGNQDAASNVTVSFPRRIQRMLLTFSGSSVAIGMMSSGKIDPSTPLVVSARRTA